MDLVAIVTSASVSASAQSLAVRSEFERRELTLPDQFDVPDRSLWEQGSAAEDTATLLDTARTLDEAIAIISGFVDPLLGGTTVGVWDRHFGAWTES